MSSNGKVAVSDWNACINATDNMLVLSCTVTTNDSSAGITGVGLILNKGDGTTLATLYTEFSGGSASAMPALNVPPNGLAVGDTVSGVATGEVDGQHFFFQEKLTIGSC